MAEVADQIQAQQVGLQNLLAQKAQLMSLGRSVPTTLDQRIRGRERAIARLSTQGVAVEAENLRRSGGTVPVPVVGEQASLLAVGRAAVDNASLPPWLLPAAAGVAGAGVVAGVVGLVASRRSKRKSSGTSKRKASKSRSRRASRKVSPTSRRNAKRNRPGGAVKSKWGGKKVYLTKKGQPYVIMGDGKARFIKR